MFHVCSMYVHLSVWMSCHCTKSTSKHLPASPLQWSSQLLPWLAVEQFHEAETGLSLRVLWPSTAADGQITYSWNSSWPFSKWLIWFCSIKLIKLLLKQWLFRKGYEINGGSTSDAVLTGLAAPTQGWLRKFSEMTRDQQGLRRANGISLASAPDSTIPEQRLQLLTSRSTSPASLMCVCGLGFTGNSFFSVAIFSTMSLSSSISFYPSHFTSLNLLYCMKGKGKRVAHPKCCVLTSSLLWLSFTSLVRSCL